LRTLEIQSTHKLTGADGNAQIQVQAKDKRGQRVSLTFALLLNCLPVEISHWYDDGSLRADSKLSYQGIPGTAAFFLKHATCKGFGPGATRDPNAQNSPCEFAFVVKDPIRANDEVVDEVFNPVLPGGTVVFDGRRNRELPSARPVFSLRQNGTEELLRSSWIGLLLFDGLFIGLCWFGRRRLFV
jgi:hypothetical protein